MVLTSAADHGSTTLLVEMQSWRHNKQKYKTFDPPKACRNISMEFREDVVRNELLEFVSKLCIRV